MRSILLFSSPVITGATLVTDEGFGVDMGDLLPLGPPSQPSRLSPGTDSVFRVSCHSAVLVVL